MKHILIYPFKVAWGIVLSLCYVVAFIVVFLWEADYKKTMEIMVDLTPSFSLVRTPKFAREEVGLWRWVFSKRGKVFE